MKKSKKHPNQSIIVDSKGVRRFQQNNIVKFLLDASGLTLNDLAGLEFDKEDRRQFAQLIGYSVDGYGDLSYAHDDDLLDKSSDLS